MTDSSRRQFLQATAVASLVAASVAPIALNASGQAKYTNSTLLEGRHALTAFYNGSPGAFNTSSGNLNIGLGNSSVNVPTKGRWSFQFAHSVARPGKHTSS